VDVARLSNAVTSVLCLCIHSRVPVRVVKDDSVGASQVDADASGPRRQDEAKNPAVGVEPFHQYLTLLHLVEVHNSCQFNAPPDTMYVISEADTDTPGVL